MRAVGRWVKRHPFWTFLVILIILIGVTPGNADTAGGLAILLVPVAILNWIVVTLRARKSKSAAPEKRLVPLIQSSITDTPSLKQQSVEKSQRQAQSLATASATADASAFVERTASEPLAPQGLSAFEETSNRLVQKLPVNQTMENLITLKDMLDMSPTGFEEFCVSALEGIGYKDVKRVGGAGDLAADIFATDPYGKSTIVQCKRYQPGSKIGSPAIQTFIGMKNVHHQADRGIFMTTADYSLPAVRLAKQHDLILVDGDDMVKIAGLVMAPRHLPQVQTAASGSRFCTSCGAEFEGAEKFCGVCGSPRRASNNT